MPHDTDFSFIANRLARMDLFPASEKPVSAAQHALIVCDALDDPSVLPWALLAACSKATLGDIEEFFFDPVLGVAKEFSEGLQRAIRAEWRDLKSHHRAALHADAELPLPSKTTEEMIARAGAVAMATERRDFGIAHPRLAGDVRPLRKVYRLRAAEDVGADLLARFKANLPCFRAGRSLPHHGQAMMSQGGGGHAMNVNR